MTVNRHLTCDRGHENCAASNQFVYTHRHPNHRLARRRAHATGSAALTILSFVAGLLLAGSLDKIQAGQIPTRGPNLPVLTRVQDIRELTPEQANQGYPVHLRAVVTYRSSGDLFVQDSSAGIWVDEPQKFSVKPGDLIEIKGKSAAPDFAPEIAGAVVQVLGKAPLPQPHHPGFERLISGSEDSQWVQVKGIVRRAAVQDGILLLDLAVGENHLTARIVDHAGAAPEALVDAKVAIEGACGALFNNRNQILGVVLNVPSLDQVRIEEPPVETSTLPIRSIETLLRFTPAGASGHRVRVSGVVTLQVPGRSLFIQDHTQGLLVHTTENGDLHEGDLIEVAGFPAPGDYTPALNDAVVTSRTRGMAPKPVRVNVTEALSGAYDGQLVEIDSRLLDSSEYQRAHKILLRDSNVLFYAQVEGNEAGERFVASIPQNSRVRLTGICAVQVDESRTPRAFQLLLRSGQDISVLQRSSWWTWSHTVSTVGMISVLFLLVLGWAAVLQRRVHAQTGIMLERLQREVALEERYRDLFENASDMVYIHDLDGNVTSLNRAGERITGYSREQALSMNLSRLIAPEYVDMARRICQPDQVDAGVATYELEIIAANGRRVPLEVSARLIHEHGKAVGVQCNARDITERKRAETEMRRAKEAAEAANRAKSEFLANVSHEIRTPMNGILGMTSLVLETSLSPDQRDYLNIVKCSANSLMVVLNDILDFSKIEARKMDLEMVEFDLRQYVNEVLRPLGVQARQKGLKLDYQCAPEVPFSLIGDPARLGQILINLAGNAIKFTQHGEVVISLAVESQTSETALLHFSVRDTGIGIPTEKHAIIFESFRQADGSTTRKFGGTGLGLAISAQLASLMGGRMWLDSEPGRGSTFHFTAMFGVPTQTAKSAPEHDATPDAPVSTPLETAERPQASPLCNSSESSPGLRILVAEDNPINQKLASRILEKRGHRVVLASNGREAIQLLEREECNGFDLVIMDVQMPEMDGLEATGVLREREKLTGKHVPVIAVTAHAMKGDRELCLAAGMDEYISKPLRAQELIATIEALAGAGAEVAC